MLSTDSLLYNKHGSIKFACLHVIAAYNSRNFLLINFDQLRFSPELPKVIVSTYVLAPRSSIHKVTALNSHAVTCH